MEQSLSDLLCDAFSETAVPSFSDGDLDFENLKFDEKLEEDETSISDETLSTKEDESLHQEATGEATILSKTESTKDKEHSDDNDEDEEEEEDFEGVGVSLIGTDRAPEEGYRSSEGDSEQESSVSGEDEEDEEEDTGTGEKPGDLLMPGCDELCAGYKEDRIFAEGQPLAPEGAENPQVRNHEQGKSESDGEVSYFEWVPQRGNEPMIKSNETEEDEQESKEEKEEDSSDSECEGMKVEQEENVLAQGFEHVGENPHRDDPEATSLELAEISVQNLQDLIEEVDSEDYVEKMKDFSGEEHQEAGESFADYPSDFSSCEYIEHKVKIQENESSSNSVAHASNSGSDAKQNTCLGEVAMGLAWIEGEEDTDEEGDEYLYSRDLEMDADKFRSFNAVPEEEHRGRREIVETVLRDSVVTGRRSEDRRVESDSYSSSDDEFQVTTRDEEFSDNMRQEDLEKDNKLENTWLYSESSAAFSRWSNSDDYHSKDSRDASDYSTTWGFDLSKTNFLLSDDLLTTENTDEAETRLSDVGQRPAEDVNAYSVIQRMDSKSTSSSYQGSLDDDFFFTEHENSRDNEVGQLADDEYEDDRNWEHEQERIDAFYRFYNDSDGENEREKRQIKVQFCTDPLSQVIHYETDSSDTSLSSSTDREEEEEVEDQNYEELREPDVDIPQVIQPASDPPETQLPDNEPEMEETEIEEPETEESDMEEPEIEEPEIEEPEIEEPEMEEPEIEEPETEEPETEESDMEEPEIEEETRDDSSDTQTCSRKNKCLGFLNLMLKMGVVIGMGLLMFWLATDQPEWFSHTSFI